jgi:hypothetical protein
VLGEGGYGVRAEVLEREEAYKRGVSDGRVKSWA